VTFDRPERLNSLTFDVYADIRDLTAELRARSQEVRVLVIRGEGRGFCSGGDVQEIIGKLLEMDTRRVYEFAQMTGACVRNLREMPQPVIAAVNGIAAGAGAVLALACDFRILARSASFEFLFTRVGISGGDMGVCWLLPRVVGLGRATEMLMLGDQVEAEEALRVGLAHRVVADDELDRTVEDLARGLLGRAPWGLAMTKEMLNRSGSMDYSSAIEMEALYREKVLQPVAPASSFAGMAICLFGSAARARRSTVACSVRTRSAERSRATSRSAESSRAIGRAPGRDGARLSSTSAITGRATAGTCQCQSTWACASTQAVPTAAPASAAEGCVRRRIRPASPMAPTAAPSSTPGRPSVAASSWS